MQNYFIWNGKRAKINHNSLCNHFERGLQKVDIQLKMDTLQMSWVKKLFDNCDHQWKTIPKSLLDKIYGHHNIFYPHFKASTPNQISSLPGFYRNILNKWAIMGSSPPLDIRNILWQYIWQKKLYKNI